jgi:uncharacterized protein YebE (UPF0316 family)
VVEVGIYLTGLSIVLQNLNSPFNIAAYCVGYGAGILIGSRIEQALALGYLDIQIITDSVEQDLAGQLRAKGYGVTAWYGEGRDGLRLVLHVLAKRSDERKLMKALREICPNAFVISYEPKRFVGGFLARHVR